MKNIIAGLLGRYENGQLSRRELIVGLTMLAAAGTKAEAATLMDGINLDHISVQVSDLKVSQDFYRNVLGLTLHTEPRADGSVRLDLGQSGFFVLRNGRPTGTVDHVAIKIEGFNRDLVTRQIRDSGVTPADDDGGAGFHVVDPDGLKIQLR